MTTLGTVKIVNDKYDIVVFGAAGYTGKYVVEEVARTAVKEHFTWAVADKNRDDISHALQSVEVITFPLEIMNTPMIVADASDITSLGNMAKQARIVLNCVGPDKLFGDKTARACVVNGTHHIDISTDPHYLESVFANLNETAKMMKAYAIISCGFDSAIIDLGLLFLQDHFNGDLNSTEVYSNMSHNETTTTSLYQYTSWVTFINSMTNRKQTSDAHKYFYPSPLPWTHQPLPDRLPVHYRGYIKSFCIPNYLYSPVMARVSQIYLYNKYNLRPVQVNGYQVVGGLIVSSFSLFWKNLVLIMCNFTWTRNLLLKYPTFFSLGEVSMDRHRLRSADDNYGFSMYFFGRGWKNKRESLQEKPETKMDKETITLVSGRNPVYGTTATVLMQAALSILKEKESMPHEYGVLTPGAAFARTTIIERLIHCGIDFQVIEDNCL